MISTHPLLSYTILPYYRIKAPFSQRQVVGPPLVVKARRGFAPPFTLSMKESAKRYLHCSRLDKLMGSVSQICFKDRNMSM